MCNKCNNDCCCNQETKPARFEVGKKYQSTDSSRKVAECVWSGKNIAVVQYEDGGETVQIHTWLNEYWKEYTEPPKVYFSDLKPGEKFRWKVDVDNKHDYICVRLVHFNGALLYAYCVDGVCEIIKSNTNSEVIRVKERQLNLTRETRVHTNDDGINILQNSVQSEAEAILSEGILDEDIILSEMWDIDWSAYVNCMELVYGSAGGKSGHIQLPPS